MAATITGEIIVGITVVGFSSVIGTIAYAYKHLSTKLDTFNSHIIRSALVETEFRDRIKAIETKQESLDVRFQTIKENLAVLSSELERHLSWHERFPGTER